MRYGSHGPFPGGRARVQPSPKLESVQTGMVVRSERSSGCADIFHGPSWHEDQRERLERVSRTRRCDLCEVQGAGVRTARCSRIRPEPEERYRRTGRCSRFWNHFASLPVLCSRINVCVVRSLAIFIVVLLLPVSLNAPSAMACPTKACCGPNCLSNAPVNQLSCCKRPVAPDRVTIQARDTQHFDSIGNMPVVVSIVAISHSRSTVVAQGYSPPDRLISLALLCSRQI